MRLALTGHDGQGPQFKPCGAVKYLDQFECFTERIEGIEFGLETRHPRLAVLRVEPLVPVVAVVHLQQEGMTMVVCLSQYEGLPVPW